MKLLFDQNLAHKLIAEMQVAYPGSQHVNELGMATTSDEEIWNYARANQMVIVSKDSDFYHRSILFGHPPKVVWITLGNCSTSQIRDLLLTRQQDLAAFEQDESASFLALG